MTVTAIHRARTGAGRPAKRMVEASRKRVAASCRAAPRKSSSPVVAAKQTTSPSRGRSLHGAIDPHTSSRHRLSIPRSWSHASFWSGKERVSPESVILTAALGTACALAGDLRSMETVRGLRDQFWASLRAHLGDRVVLNGHPERRLPNTLNVSFVERIGSDILAALEGIAASTGSACHSGRVELSPVLRAMGIPERVGMGAVRFSLGRTTAADEIAEVVECIATFLQPSAGGGAV